MELLIDNEFKNLIPPLTSEEFKQLEINCIKDGIRDAIATWNGYIIDGHNRYEIANKNGLKYVTNELIFENRTDVIEWIILNQFGRRNINNYQRSVLALRLEDVFKAKAKANLVLTGIKVSEFTNQGLSTLTNLDMNNSIFDEKPIIKQIPKIIPIDTRKELSKIANVSDGTLHKVKKIELTASPETKEKLAKGETSINEAYKEIKVQEKIEARKEMIEHVKIQIENENIILTDKYDVLVIDPPWDYGREYNPETSRVSNPYPEMSIEEIKNIELPIKENAVVFLWTTHAYLKNSFEILENWGLNYKATMVWDKDMMGMGATIRMQCEFCIIAIKGKPILNGSSERDIIREKRREHSRKPDGFYEFVERFTIGKKLDYFSRSKRDNWDVYGAETNKF